MNSPNEFTPLAGNPASPPIAGSLARRATEAWVWDGQVQPFRRMVPAVHFVSPKASPARNGSNGDRTVSGVPGGKATAVGGWESFNDPPPHESGKVMVCGHTSQKSGVPRNIGHAVCIDTWACGRGWLTCLDVGSGRYWQANQRGETRASWLEGAE